MKSDEEKITYLLEMKDGSQRKICIPTSCVLTFGALIPGSPNNNGRMGLRIRKGPQQMAVFQDVESFRNTAINIEERNEPRPQKQESLAQLRVVNLE